VTRATDPAILRYAARTQRGFGYLVGVVGSAAGTVFLLQRTPLMSAGVWALTFLFGALFVGIATVLDGLAAVLDRPTTTPPSAPDDDGLPA
jgi:hypothetical protein